MILKTEEDKVEIVEALDVRLVGKLVCLTVVLVVVMVVVVDWVAAEDDIEGLVVSTEIGMTGSSVL